MPEDNRQRETYGNAPGWSQTQRTDTGAPVPPAEEPDAPAASSTADAEAAPSAEPTSSTEQVSEPTPPPTSQPEPKKFNMPPEERWQEVIRQREEAEKRAQQAEQLAREAIQKFQSPAAPTVPVEDPWAGLVNHPDPATAQFYQQQQRLFQHEAQKVAQAQGQSVMQAVDAGRRELAAIKIATFRRDNPEIKPGSPEETAIAGYVGQGLDLDMAKKLALYDRLEAENRALKSKQSATPQKRAAAQAEPSAGIPAGAGLPGKPGDWRERVGAIVEKGGSFRDAANALFGGR